MVSRFVLNFLVIHVFYLHLLTAIPFQDDSQKFRSRGQKDPEILLSTTTAMK